MIDSDSEAEVIGKEPSSKNSEGGSELQELLDEEQKLENSSAVDCIFPIVNLETAGNEPEDWEIFNVLCGAPKQPIPAEPQCGDSHQGNHAAHALDLETTLRSELAAISYKRDRLVCEINDVRNSLFAKESECDALRIQTARQSTMVASLHHRLHTTEIRERHLQQRTEASMLALEREKRCFEDQSKELHTKLKIVESALNIEKDKGEALKTQFQSFIRALSLCMGMGSCENLLTPEIIVSKTDEVFKDLQNVRNKLSKTLEKLTNCESELINLRSSSTSERQRMQLQIEGLQSLNEDLENRIRQTEKDLLVSREKLTEKEISSDKFKDELKGFELRCGRLQTNIDRFQGDRLQFLRSVASIINVNEPCETLIKDKIRDVTDHYHQLQNQVASLREQLVEETSKHQNVQETLNCKLKREEKERCSLEERLEKATHELQELNENHACLSDYLVRLAHALCFGECSEPPTPGEDTRILAETLLERADRLASEHENQFVEVPKINKSSTPTSSAVYTLQRRLRVLREQVQRRDLHLELLRRKIALLEDGCRSRERDDAVQRARRSARRADKAQEQLVEVRTQLGEVRAQLAEAADFKISALEKARKIDELQAKISEIESEKCKLISQLASYKARARSAAESSNEKRCRDEQTINSLREEVVRLKASVVDLNHRLSQLLAFRSSVARLLHLRDLPESDLLNRLQTLCNAHQEFTLLSHKYESPCPRLPHEDLLHPIQSTLCRSVSPRHMNYKRFDEFEDQFEDHEFDFSKKY